MFIFLTVIIFVINYLIFLKLSKKFMLYDYPDSRKIHTQPVPIIGGLVIVTSFILIMQFIEKENLLQIITLSSLLILLISFIDDIKPQRVSIRILFQIFASSIIIGSGLHIKNLGGYGSLEDLQLKSLGIIFTYICIMSYINSMNFIDGLDGLSSGLFLSSLLSFLLISNINQLYINYNLIIILILLLSLFFIVNLGLFKIPKIFLGDNGSTSLAFIIGWIFIYYSQNMENGDKNLHPILAAWCLSLPTFDFVRVIIKRLSNNKNIFFPDNIHIHHILLNIGLSKKFVLIILLFFNFILIFFGYLIFTYYGPLPSMMAFCVTFFIYIIFFNNIFLKIKF